MSTYQFSPRFRPSPKITYEKGKRAIARVVKYCRRCEQLAKVRNEGLLELHWQLVQETILNAFYAAKPYQSSPLLYFLSPEGKKFYNEIIGNALSSVFFTFTFSDHVDTQQAFKSLNSFIGILSGRWRLNDNIGYIVCEEVALSGLSNFRVLRHLHGIMFSNAPLFAEGIQERWSAVFGNAKVEVYDPSRDGIGYIQKKVYPPANVADQRCELRLSENINLFSPTYKPTKGLEKRRLRRHQQRKQAEELYRMRLILKGIRFENKLLTEKGIELDREAERLEPYVELAQDNWRFLKGMH